MRALITIFDDDGRIVSDARWISPVREGFDGEMRDVNGTVLSAINRAHFEYDYLYFDDEPKKEPSINPYKKYVPFHEAGTRRLLPEERKQPFEKLLEDKYNERKNFSN